MIRICIIIKWLKSSRYFGGFLFKVDYDHDEEHMITFSIQKSLKTFFVFELGKKASF